MSPRAPGLHAAFGKPPPTRPAELDAPLRWGCSLKGWSCCVDKGIAVRPYDLLRLRHALQRPAQELVAENIVTFAWNPGTGTIYGSLAQRPYERGRVACVFLQEVTNLDARRIREEDAERFVALPETVRGAADSPARGEWKVAGLCGVHSGRPEVCRGLPFQRFAGHRPDASLGVVSVRQVHHCGSCALATATTARAVLADEQLDVYWREHEAFWQAEHYLRSLGMANIKDTGYRAFPLRAVAELWGRLYLPDLDERVRAAFPEQWRLPLDLAGDRAIHRLLLERAMDEAERLVAQSGQPADWWGFDGVAVRPDLEATVQRAEPLLPPPLARAS